MGGTDGNVVLGGAGGEKSLQVFLASVARTYHNFSPQRLGTTDLLSQVQTHSFPKPGRPMSSHTTQLGTGEGLARDLRAPMGSAWFKTPR